ncbi:MAG: sigma-70 family RNA polymerase sigma factor [Bacilli bacterium]|jgi:RNA polymerase sigma-H factor|nr:sigma-70 family RNA polymerase sigma factor [Bacilli bacterium]
MDYRNLNDNELVYLCAESNEDATNILIEKYKHCILSVLKEFLKEYNIIGLEVADLYQEGLIGLIHAINTFNECKDVTFYTYANACIRTSIISAMRSTFRKKNRILNNSYSLDKLIEETNANFYEVVEAEHSDPKDILIEEEENNELIESIRSVLSKTEKYIFELRLKGLSNIEIASLLDKDKKYVENTMFRINRKYKDLFKNKK